MRVHVAGLIASIALVAMPARGTPEVLLQQTLAITLGGQEVGTMDALDLRDKGGTTLSRITKLSVQRGATRNDMVTETLVKLAPNGAPQSYRYARTDKSGTLVTEGRIAGDKLELVTTQNGAKVKSNVPIPADSTFALALEHETRTHLKDGLSIEKNVVLEEMGAPVPMTVTVKKKGAGYLISSSFANLTTDEEVDAAGRTVVARTPAVGIVAYPVGRAPADLGTGTADLLALSTWVTKDVGAPAGRVRYRVTTSDAASFAVPEDDRQRVLKRTATTIDIEVKAGVSSAASLDDAKKKKALAATPYEAVDDARIKRTAAEVTKGAKDKRDEVARLVRFVYDHVEAKGLDRGYAPAVATLESKAGDCTEHSVLLSALARARGVPTRLVDGVVVDQTRAGYHEWVEVWLEGEGFVAADPTFGVFPAGPERLKLAEGSTAPDEHLLLSLAAARLLKPGTRVDVIETAPLR
ncbi:MAG: transglutaminase domain-containing protein [Deltaproteobacteria bacterium]|nr:transglutaminase domain-containing protein [Deltaproteobacteria bacterium]